MLHVVQNNALPDCDAELLHARGVLKGSCVDLFNVVLGRICDTLAIKCVCVYMYVYVYVCVVYVCVCVCVCMYVCMYVCMCVCVYKLCVHVV